MTRTACALVIAALAILLVLLHRVTGATAIAFSFLGVPLLAGAIALQLLAARRAGPAKGRGPERFPPRGEEETTRRETLRMIGFATLLSLLLPGAAALAAEPDGAAVYSAQCAKCHGADGRADTPAAKALKAPPLIGGSLSSRDAEAIAQEIRENPKHAAALAKLSPAEVEAVARTVRAMAVAANP